MYMQYKPDVVSDPFSWAWALIKKALSNVIFHCYVSAKRLCSRRAV